jgi:hypothetical protein
MQIESHAHDKELCALFSFKSRLYPRNVRYHCPLAVRSDGDQLHRLLWIDDVQNTPTQRELRLSSLALKKRKRWHVKTGNYPGGPAAANAYIEIRRSLSITDIKQERISPATAQNLENRGHRPSASAGFAALTIAVSC